MQLLSTLDTRREEGLNLIPGEVRYMDYVIKKKLALPHVGWNKINLKNQNHLITY